MLKITQLQLACSPGNFNTVLKLKKYWSRRLVMAPHKWRWSHFSWESRKENTYIKPSYHLSLNCRPRCFSMICSFDPLSPRLVKVRNIFSRILGVSWRIPMLLKSLLVFMSYKFNYWYFFNDPTLKLSNLHFCLKKKVPFWWVMLLMGQVIHVWGQEIHEKPQ